MSTKIYDGFRFKAKNLDEVLSLLKQFSTEANNKAQELGKEKILNVALSMLDEAFLNINHMITEEKDKKKSFLSVAKNNIKDDLKASEKGEICYSDLSLEIVVLAYKKNYLAIPYSSENEMKELILKQPWYEEYGYWDNTDQPEHLTNRQWNRRKKVWNCAFGDDYIPANAGYTKTILKCNDFFYYMLKITEEDVHSWLKHEKQFDVKTFEKRVRENAVSLVSQHIKMTQPNENSDDVYALYQLARESRKPENQYHDIYLEKKAILEELLPKTITLELLSKNFNEIQEISKDKQFLLEQMKPSAKNSKKAKI